MSIDEVRAEDLASYLLETKLPCTLVEFSGPDCSACRLVNRILAELQPGFEGRVGFVQVELDDGSDVGVRMKIRSVPTLVLFEGSREIRRAPGAPSRSAIQSFIEGGIRAAPNQTKQT